MLAYLLERNRIQQKYFCAGISKVGKVVKDTYTKRKYSREVQMKEKRDYGKQLLFAINKCNPSL